MALTFLGLWNAQTNTPTLSNGTGTTGYAYTISTTGIQDLGNGPVQYTKGYTIIYTAFGEWILEQVQYTLDLAAVYGSGGGGGMTNPMTSTGDIIYSSDNSGTPARRGIGTAGQYLKVVAGLPTWSTLTIGLITLDGDATSAQTLSVGTTGTDFGIVSNGIGNHAFNLPTASASNRGALSTLDWVAFNAKLTSVTGTTNRILITSGSTDTPHIDIDPGYIGQPSISTVGTILNGIWHGTVVGSIYGGTGQTGYNTGDILYASAVNTLSRLSIGTAGQQLVVSGGVPTWVTTSGTTSTVSVATANGFAGSVSGGPVPAITLRSTTVGLLKSDGTAISAAISTPGDLVYETSGTTVDRLPIGTANQVLTVVSGLPKWQTPTWLTDPMTTRGDMIYESSGTTAVRLPIGTTDQVLTVQSSGLPAWATSTALTNPMVSAGDMIYETSGTTVGRLAPGGANMVLTLSASQLPTWSAYKGLLEEIVLEDSNSSIAATTYTLTPSAVYGYTINNVKAICTSGTCTLAIKINGVSVTGISAVAVSNVIATGTATALNTVATGDVVTAVTTSNSSLIDIKLRLSTTRLGT